MNTTEWLEILQTVGVPSVVCAASFYYIFKKDIWSQRERESFIKQDAENDERIFQLAENSNAALNNMSKSLDANTHALDQFRQLIARSNGGK
tara:strand:- start:1299 stop:1574 length:276 start_codon:yes stop_codon:yes gene_type:complete